MGIFLFNKGFILKKNENVMIIHQETGLARNTIVFILFFISSSNKLGTYSFDYTSEAL